MLQNRVDPSGDLIFTAARGSWMGNRGLIHNEHQQIIRLFKLKAWLICRLEFKGWKRKVMTPNRYTELFFMDEATAFAAGHRPCFECRRDHFDRFKSAWIQGNPGHSFTMKTVIREIDLVLHTERMNKDGTKVLFTATASYLPDGCFILKDGEPWLLSDGHWFHWTPFGYDKKISADPGEQVQILTPASTVNAFRAGYSPQMAIHSQNALPHTEQTAPGDEAH